VLALRIEINKDTPRTALQSVTFEQARRRPLLDRPNGRIIAGAKR